MSFAYVHRTGIKLTTATHNVLRSALTTHMYIYILEYVMYLGGSLATHAKGYATYLDQRLATHVLEYVRHLDQRLVTHV